VSSTESAPYNAVARRPASRRDFAELTLGFAAIIAILWLPTHEQLIFGPIALLAPLVLVLWRRPRLHDLGLGWRGFVSSLWILPATVALSVLGIEAAKYAGTFHPLYAPDFGHVGGYVLWTIVAAAVLFALAHLPNIPLVLATLAWGAASCTLFRRYRNLYVLGLAQGLLGLCFAICVPDAWHHHMRVGLGYLRYHPTQP
jgi:hypothetical protein